ncbi:MAG: hypothetical protein V7641_3373 [Blastocatellia bacterium]
MAEEFYPMPLFVKLMVRDVARSAEWYAAALGFRSVYAMPGADGRQVMNHIRLDRYQDLMLLVGPQSKDHMAERDFVINLTFAGDMQALAERARATGAKVEGPLTRPWNTLEVIATDPDGFVLTFSQVLDASRKFSDVMPPSVS